MSAVRDARWMVHALLLDRSWDLIEGFHSRSYGAVIFFGR